MFDQLPLASMLTSLADSSRWLAMLMARAVNPVTSKALGLNTATSPLPTGTLMASPSALAPMNTQVTQEPRVARVMTPQVPTTK